LSQLYKVKTEIINRKV